MTRHIYIPDVQLKPGVPMSHLEAAGNYVVDKRPDIVILAGDWWDMHSLSEYDKQKGEFHSRRYKDDIEAGIEGMERFMFPIWRHNKRQARNRKKQYKPRFVFTTGNHEFRVDRAVEKDLILEGVISRDDFQLEKFGIEVYDFLEIVTLDGVQYSHYFVNPHSAKKNVIGGSIENCIKNVGHSFTMGHQQGRKYGSLHFGDGTERHGLIAGSFYQHDEGYMGPQGNPSHWRGIVMKNEVKDGKYDPCFISLEYLLKEWL